MKRKIIQMLVDIGETIIQVDGRQCTGLPAQFSGENQLGLRLGHFMTPVMHLLFEIEGVEGWFSFDRQQHYVIIPWTALYAAWLEKDDPENRIIFPNASIRASQVSVPVVAVDDAVTTPHRPKLKLVD